MATVPQLHHADLLLFHSLLCNYSWFTSTRESSRVMLIPSIIISQTGSRPEQSWRTTEVLWDMIMKQTGLWATSTSCYHQVYQPGSRDRFIWTWQGPWLLCIFISHNTRTTTEYLSLEVRAVRELGRLHTEVNMSLSARKTMDCYSTLGAPSSHTHGYMWSDMRQTGTNWSLLQKTPLETSGQILVWGTARMSGWQTPLNPKGGQCCLCRNIR